METHSSLSSWTDKSHSGPGWGLWTWHGLNVLNGHVAKINVGAPSRRCLKKCKPAKFSQRKPTCNFKGGCDFQDYQLTQRNKSGWQNYQRRTLRNIAGRWKKRHGHIHFIGKDSTGMRKDGQGIRFTCSKCKPLNNGTSYFITDECVPTWRIIPGLVSV